MQIERVLVPLDNQPLLGLYDDEGEWSHSRPADQEDGRKDVFWSCHVEGYSFRFAYCPMGMEGEFMPHLEGAPERVKINSVRVQRLFPAPPSELTEAFELAHEAEQGCSTLGGTNTEEFEALFLQENGFPYSELEERMDSTYTAINDYYSVKDVLQFYEERWDTQVVEYKKLWDRFLGQRESEDPILNPFVWAFDVEVVPAEQATTKCLGD